MIAMEQSGRSRSHFRFTCIASAKVSTITSCFWPLVSVRKIDHLYFVGSLAGLMSIMQHLQWLG